MERNMNILEVNTYGEIEVEQEIYKNCTNCEFAKLQESGNVLCFRRVFENVIVEIEKDKLLIDCPARDAEKWDEDLWVVDKVEEDRSVDWGYLEDIKE
jgi:hypothetical protein